jgi:hypothetical protein
MAKTTPDKPVRTFATAIVWTVSASNSNADNLHIFQSVDQADGKEEAYALAFAKFRGTLVGAYTIRATSQLLIEATA